MMSENDMNANKVIKKIRESGDQLDAIRNC